MRVPQAVPSPSTGYATGTVFEEILTATSFSPEDDISTKKRRLSSKKETGSRKRCRRAISQIQAPEAPTYSHLTIEEFLELVENNQIEWIF